MIFLEAEQCQPECEGLFRYFKTQIFNLIPNAVVELLKSLYFVECEDTLPTHELCMVQSKIEKGVFIR